MKALLADALELPAAERPAFVERAAGSDAALRAELLTLIAAADNSRTPLDDSPADLAQQALEGPHRAGRDRPPPGRLPAARRAGRGRYGAVLSRRAC